MSPWTTLVAVLMGYLLGAVPFGIVLGRLVGKDPREVGSGRTGMTNVYRAAGMWPAVGTLAGDVLKATVAVWLARWMVADPTAEAWAVALTALAAIIGHNWSVYIGFGGGAGASPNAGALLGIDPIAFLVGGPAALVIWRGVGIASIATLSLSVVALVAMVGRVTLEDWHAAYLAYGFGQAVIVVWALRPNIARLVRGEERRIDRVTGEDSTDGNPGTGAT